MLGGPEPEEKMPTWVKALLVGAVVLVVGFVAFHLATGGLGSHGP